MKGQIYEVVCSECRDFKAVNSEQEAEEWLKNHKHVRKLTKEEIDLLYNSDVNYDSCFTGSKKC